MPREPTQNDPLTECHGYIVLADDGWPGSVGTRLIRGDVWGLGRLPASLPPTPDLRRGGGR